MVFFKKERKKINKCIKRKQGTDGVIKISHFNMNEIVRLCLYTIKTTKDTDLQHQRSERILERIEKYLIQTGKNQEYFEQVKEENRGVLPI